MPSPSIESVALDAWPPLPLDGWRDTYVTLQLWTQVVGKLALALSPLTNHYWNTALQITPRGLATLPLTVDRKSTRLNSSHGYISYAVFCLKKKKKIKTRHTQIHYDTHPSND